MPLCSQWQSQGKVTATLRVWGLLAPELRCHIVSEKHSAWLLKPKPGISPQSPTLGELINELTIPCNLRTVTINSKFLPANGVYPMDLGKTLPVFLLCNTLQSIIYSVSPQSVAIQDQGLLVL